MVVLFLQTNCYLVSLNSSHVEFSKQFENQIKGFQACFAYYFVDIHWELFGTKTALYSHVKSSLFIFLTLGSFISYILIIFSTNAPVIQRKCQYSVFKIFLKAILDRYTSSPQTLTQTLGFRTTKDFN